NSIGTGCCRSGRRSCLQWPTDGVRDRDLPHYLRDPCRTSEVVSCVCEVAFEWESSRCVETALLGMDSKECRPAPGGPGLRSNDDEASSLSGARAVVGP